MAAKAPFNRLPPVPWARTCAPAARERSRRCAMPITPPVGTALIRAADELSDRLRQQSISGFVPTFSGFRSRNGILPDSSSAPPGRAVPTVEWQPKPHSTGFLPFCRRTMCAPTNGAALYRRTPSPAILNSQLPHPWGLSGRFIPSTSAAGRAVSSTQAGRKPLRIALRTDRTFDQAAQ